MPKYIFTFGSGQENAGRCQPIVATNEIQARQRMFEVYGNKWAFMYTEEEWNKSVADGTGIERPLMSIICEEGEK